MIDYKELVARLRSYAWGHQERRKVRNEAADAIESLLAERDTALADARRYRKIGVELLDVLHFHGMHADDRDNCEICRMIEMFRSRLESSDDQA